MKRVLVTGASGFVGRAAVQALRDRGYEVHGVARTPAQGVSVDVWHAADLLQASRPAALVREAGAAHLLHLAWTTAHGRYWSDGANLAWSRASLALVEEFAAAGGVRAVMAGSCAQYDWRDADELLSETATPRRPATLYGRAKQATSELLEAWSPAAGISYATALLFFPYGAFEGAERLVPSVARSLLAGEPAAVTVGSQVRDFLHVADCGAALAALLDGTATGAVNVGSGRGASVAHVARTVARIVGREGLLRIGSLASDDQAPRVVADTARLREEVGFAPRYDLEAGLRDAVEWWRAQGGPEYEP